MGGLKEDSRVTLGMLYAWQYLVEC